MPTVNVYIVAEVPLISDHITPEKLHRTFVISPPFLKGSAEVGAPLSWKISPLFTTAESQINFGLNGMKANGRPNLR
jgi:hypothetical protein